MAVLGALGLRFDPPLACNFLVSLMDSSSAMALGQSLAASAIADYAIGGFTECSGLEMTLDIEPYQEGGRNGHVLQFPTRVKWANIVLKKGLAPGLDLWNWHYSFVEGRGTRRDGVITLVDERRLPLHIWQFRRGLPVKYTGPSLQADRGAAAIESIEIAHEGIFQLPYVGAAAAGTRVAAGATG